ncbi:hypothetical protein DXG01_002933 [Tephrocybe rancida]|nr:hypothetical protein DXG01_002933 [Tephrocybe rancida]
MGSMLAPILNAFQHDTMKDKTRTMKAPTTALTGVAYSRARIAQQETSAGQLFSNSPLTTLPHEFSHEPASRVEQSDSASWTTVTHKKKNTSTAVRAGPGKSSKGFTSIVYTSASVTTQYKGANASERLNDAASSKQTNPVTTLSKPAKVNITANVGAVKPKNTAATSKEGMGKGKAPTTNIAKHQGITFCNYGVYQHLGLSFICQNKASHIYSIGSSHAWGLNKAYTVSPRPWTINSSQKQIPAPPTIYSIAATSKGDPFTSSTWTFITSTSGFLSSALNASPTTITCSGCSATTQTASVGFSTTPCYVTDANTFFVSSDWVGLPSATSPSCKPELQAVMREESEDEDEDMDEDKDDEHIKEIKPPFSGFTADGRTPQFCQGIYYSMCYLRQLPLCFDDQIEPMDSDDNPADYASLKLDHNQTKTWVLMPVGYRPSQWVDTQDFSSAMPSDEALPVLTTDKESVFCYEDATQCIYYTGEFVKGRWEVWEKNCKWARFKHKQWYTPPTDLEDSSSDSGSSYGGTARAARIEKEATAARQKKSPPPTTEDEDAEIDMELAHETVPDKEPITPHVDKGKGRAIEEEDEGMQGDNDNMQGDNDDMQGNDNNMQGDVNNMQQDNNNMQQDDDNMQGVGTDEEGDHTFNSDDDDTVPRLSRQLKGGRIPNTSLKACSDFGNKTCVGADELTAQDNCKRQTVLMKAGLYIASAHSDHVYNDFKT